MLRNIRNLSAPRPYSALLGLILFLATLMVAVAPARAQVVLQSLTLSASTTSTAPGSWAGDQNVPLNVPFSPTTNNYSATFPALTTAYKVTVTLAPADVATTAITIAGNTAASGTPFTINRRANVSGVTTINLIQSGRVVQTYSITTSRATNSDTTMAEVRIMYGTNGVLTCTPATSICTTASPATIGSEATTITLRGTTLFSGTTPGNGGRLIYNSTDVTRAVVSGTDVQVNVPAGNTSFTYPIRVVSEDGTATQDWRVILPRSTASNVSSLSNVNGVTLKNGTTGLAGLAVGDAFTLDGSSGANYFFTVPSGVDKVRVNFNTTSPTINRIRVGGPSFTGVTGRFFDLARNTDSGDIPIPSGASSISATVWAEDNFSNTLYYIRVMRLPATSDTDAFLTGLTVSTGATVGDIPLPLSPFFWRGTDTYTVSPAWDMTQIWVTPNAPAGATVRNGVGGPIMPLNQPYRLALVSGSNTFTLQVTSPNGQVTRNVILNVARSAQTDAGLRSIALSGNQTVPNFASGTFNYNVTVPDSLTTLILSATASQTGTSLDIGTDVSGTVTSLITNTGTATTPVTTLAVGTTRFVINTTAQGGTTRATYRVNVTRNVSTDTTMSLQGTPQGGTLTTITAPSSGTTWTWNVPNGTQSVTLRPTLMHPNATVKVNNVTVTPGTNSGLIQTPPGTTAVPVEVTAESGAVTTYTVNIVRRSNDTSLNAISGAENGGTLAALALKPNSTTTYLLEVPFGTQGVMLNVDPTHAAASVRINGTAAPHGGDFGPVALTQSPQNITVLVTAEDGTTRTYTVETTIQAASTNTALTRMAVTAGNNAVTLSQTGNDYTATVPNGVTSVTITPTLADATASVAFTGTGVTAGTGNATLALTPGSNTATVTVTAQDGTTTTAYRVIITRQSADSTIQSIKATPAGGNQQTLTATNNAYALTVGSTVTSVELLTALNDAGATMTIDGTARLSGDPHTVTLSGTTTTVSIEVTAEDTNFTTTYTLTITRQSGDATLASLKATPAGGNQQTLTATNNAYALTVGATVQSVDLVAALNHAAASMTVAGNATASGATSTVQLTGRTTTVNIVVTAEDTQVTRTYTLTITRPSNDATLRTLVATPQNGTAQTLTATGTAYTLTVPPAVSSVLVTPTVTDARASLKVNNTTHTSGTARNITLSAAGSTTTVSMEVTAEDGSQATYTLSILRQSADSTLRTLAASVGGQAFTMAQNGTSFTGAVAGTTTSIDFEAITNDPNATITTTPAATPANNVYSFNLSVGPNTITFRVRAQSGSTTDYTVTITRAPLPTNNDTLQSLRAASGGTAVPLTRTVNTWSATVPNGTTSLDLTAVAQDAAARLELDGVQIANNIATNVPLQPGLNSFALKITSPDGTRNTTHTIEITRSAPLSSDASIADITATGGGNTITLTHTGNDWTGQVDFSVDKVQVTPGTVHAGASVTVDGNAVAAGAASGDIQLTAGQTTAITVVVRAADGTTATYRVRIARLGPSADSTIGGITATGGGNTVTLARTGNDWTGSVPYAVDKVRVTPGTIHQAAGVTVDGTTVAAGSTSGDIALGAGGQTRTIPVVVTAQDGSSTTYRVLITRDLPDVGIGTMGVSAGATAVALTRTGTAFAGTVGFSVASVSIAATPADGAATIAYTGTGVTAGNNGTARLTLAVGQNTATVTVTGRDGTTTARYTVTITRSPASTDTSLQTLDAQSADGPVTLVRTGATYTGGVPARIATVTVTPLTGHPSATVTVNGTPVPRGQSLSNVPLGASPSTTTILVEVTAEDGTTTQLYTLEINRAAFSNNAALASVDVTTDGGQRIAGAIAGTTVTANVPFRTHNVKIRPLAADANATVTVNGTAVPRGQETRDIAVGNQAIDIEVTAEDGATIARYQLTLTRSAAANDAALVGLAVSPGSLDFDPAQTQYSVALRRGTPAVRVTPVTRDPAATVLVNGQPVASGQPSADLDPANPVSVVVTAEDGATSMTYIIGFTEMAGDPSSDLSLKSIVDNEVTIIQDFARAHMANVQARLSDLHRDMEPDFDQGISLSVAGQSLPVTFNYTADDATAAEQAIGRALKPKLSPIRLRFWTAGSIEISIDNTTGHVASNSEAGNLTVGVDTEILPGLKGGIVVGRNSSSTKFGTDGSEAIYRGVAGSLYASWQPRPGVFVDGLLGGGSGLAEIRRYDAATGALAVGTRDYDTQFASVSISADIKEGDFTLSPSLQLDVSKVTLWAYDETGAGANNLAYLPVTNLSIKASAMVKASYSFLTEYGTFKPSVGIGIRHEFRGDYTQQVAYLGNPGVPYAVHGNGSVGDELLLSLALNYRPDMLTNIDLSYDGAFAEAAESHVVRGQISRQF